MRGLPTLCGAAKRSQKLTPLQARFILDCLTVSYELTRAKGGCRRKRGIYLHLAKRFGVTRHAIAKIATRENWKGLRITNFHDLTRIRP